MQRKQSSNGSNCNNQCLNPLRTGDVTKKLVVVKEGADCFAVGHLYSCDPNQPIIFEDSFYAVYGDIVNLTVNTLTGGTGCFEELCANHAVINSLTGGTACFEELCVNHAVINSLTGGTACFEELCVNHAVINSLTGGTACFEELCANHAVINSLTGGTACFQELCANHAVINSLTGGTACFDFLCADQAVINSLTGGTACFEELCANHAVINSLTGGTACFHELCVDYANIVNLNFNTVNLTVDSITGGTACFNELCANHAAINSLTGGTATISSLDVTTDLCIPQVNLIPPLPDPTPTAPRNGCLVYDPIYDNVFVSVPYVIDNRIPLGWARLQRQVLQDKFGDGSLEIAMDAGWTGQSKILTNTPYYVVPGGMDATLSFTMNGVISNRKFNDTLDAILTALNAFASSIPGLGYGVAILNFVAQFRIGVQVLDQSDNVIHDRAVNLTLGGIMTPDTFMPFGNEILFTIPGGVTSFRVRLIARIFVDSEGLQQNMSMVSPALLVIDLINRLFPSIGLGSSANAWITFIYSYGYPLVLGNLQQFVRIYT